MTDFTSPVGRFVQGSLTLQAKKDNDGKPVLDKAGQPVQEVYIGLAVRKDDPELNAFYALYVATARAAFPGMFDANGQCVNPSFAWKIQDGDGRDQSGKSVADKPGFAGCYVFKFATMYAPSVWARDSNQNLQQLTDPSIVKKGYKIRISGTLAGNGVTPGGAAKPGLYASPNMILFVAPDEEIASGGDPNKAFGNLPSQAGLAVGGVPMGGGLPTLTAPAAVQTPPQLGGLAAPQIGGMGLGGLAAPQLGGLQPMQTLAAPQGLQPMVQQVQPQVPQYTPTAAMQGATIEYATAAPPAGLGWTIEALLEKGMVVKNW